MKLTNWLNKGDGGYSPYEPYLTNKDLLIITTITLLGSASIITGCILITQITY
jgi:hypothetical protein